MNRTAPPAPVSRLTAANSRSLVATSRAEVASSRMSTFGARSSARPMAHRLALAQRQRPRRGGQERVRAVAEEPGQHGPAALAPAARVAGACAAGAAQHPVRAEPQVVEDRLGRHALHFLEHGGDPGIAAAAGARGRTRAAPTRASATRPPGTAARGRRPARCTPDRILTRVDLPEPFSPMSAWTSPARSSSEQPRSATVGPKALVTPSTRSSVAGGAAVCGACVCTDLAEDGGQLVRRQHVEAGRAAGVAGR